MAEQISQLQQQSKTEKEKKEEARELTKTMIQIKKKVNEVVQKNDILVEEKEEIF